MPPKERTSKQHPPSVTKSTASTRRMGTRSTNRGAAPVTAEAGTQKRKAEDLPCMDQPTKRSTKKALGVKNVHPAANATKEATETTLRVSARTAEQGIPSKSKTGVRKAPARPTPSSDSEDGEEDTANHTTDGGATSPLPSDDEADEYPTAIQLAEERPQTGAGVTTGRDVKYRGDDGIDNNLNDHETTLIKPTVHGERRAHRIIREVPAPGPSFQQPGGSPVDMTDPGAMTIIHPQISLFPNHGNMVLAPPVPAWPAFTELIQEDNGSYKQTSQTAEINNCLSAAVKRANSNLLLINSFPDVDQQEQWLVDGLKFELSARTCGHVIKAVGECARVDIDYFYCLLSMIRNRWSGYRQTVLNVARALVGSPHPGKKPSEKAQAKMKAKTSYKLLGSADAEKAEIATKLLHQEAFHFGTTKAGAPDGTAPYQRQEMLFILAYFFRCDNSLEGQVPTGECGQEIPKPMVALAATLIEVALTEIAEGTRVKFSEDKQKDRYTGHLNSFERVRVSKNGGRKLARLLSDIYNGTMNELLSKGSPDDASGPSTGPTLMDTDNMRV
ncbi:hypothetical protein BJ322DRAFT_1112629 [Thelephora terrestris]|uniref:DUF6532 domain-containing protein n=1 Tax=Thelephora terrestris TaxID=56493 RepID=A0A9P6H6Q8_9AGAM|nr:hypothetical protein BJ322DRAFT_1112629 [Thelephora terrestris]